MAISKVQVQPNGTPSPILVGTVYKQNRLRSILRVPVVKTEPTPSRLSITGTQNPLLSPPKCPGQVSPRVIDIASIDDGITDDTSHSLVFIDASVSFYECLAVVDDINARCRLIVAEKSGMSCTHGVSHRQSSIPSFSSMPAHPIYECLIVVDNINARYRLIFADKSVMSCTCAVPHRQSSVGMPGLEQYSKGTVTTGYTPRPTQYSKGSAVNGSKGTVTNGSKGIAVNGGHSAGDIVTMRRARTFAVDTIKWLRPRIYDYYPSMLGVWQNKDELHPWARHDDNEILYARWQRRQSLVSIGVHMDDTVI